MRQGFFPDMTYSQLYMEYKLPEGTSPSRVEADLKEIREWLQKRPEIKDVTTSLGGTPARYNLVRSIATPSLSYGELIIDFTDPKTLEKSIDGLQELMTLEMSKAANELDESEYERALAASNTASAEENVRVSRLHYDAGTETLSDLLEAQTLCQVANRDSVEADINHFLAWLSYLKTTGQICNEFIK